MLELATFCARCALNMQLARMYLVLNQMQQTIALSFAFNMLFDIAASAELHVVVFGNLATIVLARCGAQRRDFLQSSSNEVSSSALESSSRPQ